MLERDIRYLSLTSPSRLQRTTQWTSHIKILYSTMLKEAFVKVEEPAASSSSLETLARQSGPTVCRASLPCLENTQDFRGHESPTKEGHGCAYNRPRLDTQVVPKLRQKQQVKWEDMVGPGKRIASWVVQ
ncbi:hypothetical protein PAMP_007664 [Pampus punctatissimus]